MAKRSEFNLSEAIREYRKGHPKATANEALEAVSKTAPKKINAGTFRSTFYKISGQGKRRTVRRKKPGRGGAGDSGGGIIAQALAFVKSAGGIERAKQALAELEQAVSEL
jgi:hypothetical protein